MKHPSGSPFAFREARTREAIAARKRPSQARSRATVEAILEATSRVLVAEGYAAMTTTRVASTAGVGVGTLYQYFPAKESLVIAVLERQMERMEASLGAAILASAGDGIDARIEATIDALIAHKAERPELSVALRTQLPQVDGQRCVRSALRRVQAGLRAMLEAHARELPGVDLDLASLVITTSVEGTVSSALDHAPTLLREPAFRDALVHLVRGYLREAGAKRKTSARRG